MTGAKVLLLLSIFGIGTFAIPQDVPPPFDDEPQDQDVPPPFDRQDPPQPEIPGEELANVEYGYHQYTDMILDDVQDRLFRGIDTDADRNAIIGDKYRWPGGVMPYKFDASVDETMKKRIKNYVEKFNAQMSGCLEIRAATSSDKNYAQVTDADGCFSYVGMRNSGAQKVWLKSGGCSSYPTFVHEFLHAYGLYHEHNRPDRDDYVEIKWDNIIKKWQYAYNKCKSCETYNVPYDGRSVMHYHPWGFAIDNSKFTMESKMSGFASKDLGKTEDYNQPMTANDVKKMEIMYGCKVSTTTPPVTTPAPCENKHVSDSDCDRWAGYGYCEKSYVEWMTKNCAKSCTKNKQSDKNCNYWAGKGYCTKTYEAYMKKNCAKACNIC